MSLTRLLRENHRRDLEWVNGRLNKFPNIWEYVNKANVPQEALDKLAEKEPGQGATGPDGDYHGGFTWYRVEPETGKHIRLAKVRCVICPNHELWPDRCPSRPRHNGAKGEGKDEIKGRWVPMSVCRKCEFYRTTRATGLHYATCQWSKMQRTEGGRLSATTVAARKQLEIWSKATKTVDEWLK